MIKHTSVVVSSYNDGKTFYQSLLAPLGYTLEKDFADFKAGGFSDGKTIDFWVAEDQHPDGGKSHVHVAFAAVNKEAVEAFHAAGLAAGGSDNGEPGYRDQYHAGYYAAFIHDPDGNNIEAVWMDASKM